MSSLEDRLTERLRQGSDEPEESPAPEEVGRSSEAPYELEEICELGEAMNHHSCCVVGVGSGNVLFQGGLDGQHWFTIATLTIEANEPAAFAGTGRADTMTPTVFTYLRAVPDGELTGGPFDVYFASS